MVKLFLLIKKKKKLCRKKRKEIPTDGLISLTANDVFISGVEGRRVVFLKIDLEFDRSMSFPLPLPGDHVLI